MMRHETLPGETAMANQKATEALKLFLRPIANAHGMGDADAEPFVEAIVKALRDSGMSEPEIIEAFGDPVEEP
jgi:hypothetical protein